VQKEYAMRAVAAPIRFAGSQLAEARHVCAFFNSDDEEYRVLLPFIKDGFECGDKAIHVVNPDQRHAHPQRLAAVGIDPTAAHKVDSWNFGHRDIPSGRPFRSGSHVGSVRAVGQRERQGRISPASASRIRTRRASVDAR
jgi:hypothetical protein